MLYYDTCMASEKTFKQLEQELDEILERVESAAYDELDDLLKDYETGKKLIEQLEKKLKSAKNSIKKVKK